MIETIKEFLHMGGYAFYVWCSYVLFFLVIMIDMIGLKKQDKLVKRNIKSFLRRKNTD